LAASGVVRLPPGAGAPFTFDLRNRPFPPRLACIGIGLAAGASGIRRLHAPGPGAFTRFDAPGSSALRICGGPALRQIARELAARVAAVGFRRSSRGAIVGPPGVAGVAVVICGAGVACARIRAGLGSGGAVLLVPFGFPCALVLAAGEPGSALDAASATGVGLADPAFGPGRRRLGPFEPVGPAANDGRAAQLLTPDFTRLGLAGVDAGGFESFPSPAKLADLLALGDQLVTTAPFELAEPAPLRRIRGHARQRPGKRPVAPPVVAVVAPVAEGREGTRRAGIATIAVVGEVVSPSPIPIAVVAVTPALVSADRSVAVTARVP
jgi:hypothetical protein